jgi:hypothetical protein
MNGECAMKAALAFRKALLFGLLMLLLLFPIKTKAGSPIGSSIVVSAGSEQEVSPAIAYNSQRQEYLVVWYNDRPGCDDIRAQRISANGKLAGSPFYISYGCDLDRRYPDVTYNSVHDQYLVVWEQYDPNTTLYSIQGRRIDGNGALLDTSDITIRSAGNQYTPTKPSVDFASYSDRYLVVWAEGWPTTNTYYILGQVLTSAGALEGSRFSITSGTAIVEEPDVAYNRHANRYLVVWQIAGSSDDAVSGQQVHGYGGLYQNNIIWATYYPVISVEVAALSTSPDEIKFLWVHESWNASTYNDVWECPTREDGSFFWCHSLTTYNYDTSPAVAASESSLQYFVVWRREFQGSGDSSILGRAISFDGNYNWGVSEFLGEDVNFPAVAAGPAGDFLVVWQDKRANNTNIYGQLWGNWIYLPLMIRD